MPRYERQIPAQPFIDWFDKRRDLIERDLNNTPAIKGWGGYAFPEHCGPTTRLMLELGWRESDLRRLRQNRASGWVDRTWVEDSLWRAGVAFEDVYPEQVRERVCA